MYVYVAMKFEYLTSVTRNKYKFKGMIKIICGGEMSSSRRLSIFDNFYFEERASRTLKKCPPFLKSVQINCDRFSLDVT